MSLEKIWLVEAVLPVLGVYLGLKRAWDVVVDATSSHLQRHIAVATVLTTLVMVVVAANLVYVYDLHQNWAEFFVTSHVIRFCVYLNSLVRRTKKLKARRSLSTVEQKARMVAGRQTTRKLLVFGLSNMALFVFCTFFVGLSVFSLVGFLIDGF